MKPRPSRSATRLALSLIGATAALLLPAAAHGADRVYWANSGPPGRISFGGLDGAGRDLEITGANNAYPQGLALDPSSGRAYWSNESIAGAISYANLDGSGGGGDLQTGAATSVGPEGASIDPVGRRIYWGNVTDKISFANLDGSGGGDLNTGSATVNGPSSLTVDPASHRVYWTNNSGNSISYANLDDSGGGNLVIAGSATPESPLGLAIDPVGKRIYWANGNGSIAYANLDGSGSAKLNVAGATLAEPYGLAIDPEAHRIYWANQEGGISYADTEGRGGADIPFSAKFVAGRPNSPNLFQVPRPIGPASISAGGRPGTELSCGAAWLADIPEAHLFRAPGSTGFAWSSNGEPVGDTTEMIAATAVGVYRCAGTASNLAGSATQESPPTAIYRLGKVKVNRRAGTAKIVATLPGAGQLSMRGKGVKRAGAKVGAAKTTTLLVRTKGAARKKLAGTGRAKLKLTFSFAIPNGVAAVQQKSIVLRKK